MPLGGGGGGLLGWGAMAPRLPNEIGAGPAILALSVT